MAQEGLEPSGRTKRSETENIPLLGQREEENEPSWKYLESERKDPPTSAGSETENVRNLTITLPRENLNTKFHRSLSHSVISDEI